MKSFVAVHEKGTFVGAARDLGISQPSLSRHIQSLEALLGVRLFDRHTRNVGLSRAGEELLPICQRMLTELDNGSSEMADIAAGRRGRVTIAVLPSIARVLFPLSLPAFRSENPEVEIRVIDGVIEAIEEAVLLGRADFGLSARPATGEGIHFRQLFDDPMTVLMHKDDAFASRDTVTWADLSERPFIALAARTSIRYLTDLGFAKAGIVMEPTFVIASAHMAVTLTVTGLGLTAIPRLNLAEAKDTDLIAKPLVSPSIARNVGIITARSRSTSPPARRLMEMIAEGTLRFDEADVQDQVGEG